MKIEVIDYKSSSASNKFVKSLEKTGFAVLKNHSIDSDLIKSVYSDWESFFKTDAKHNYTDAFEYFKENGIFNTVIADSFRENILEKGNTEPPMDMYIKFRGKEPDPDALLRRDNLI